MVTQVVFATLVRGRSIQAFNPLTVGAADIRISIFYWRILPHFKYVQDKM